MLDVSVARVDRPGRASVGVSDPSSGAEDGWGWCALEGLVECERRKDGRCIVQEEEGESSRREAIQVHAPSNRRSSCLSSIVSCRFAGRRKSFAVGCEMRMAASLSDSSPYACTQSTSRATDNKK